MFFIPLSLPPLMPVESEHSLACSFGVYLVIGTIELVLPDDISSKSSLYWFLRFLASLLSALLLPCDNGPESLLHGIIILPLRNL